jgi:hypothetical protein
MTDYVICDVCGENLGEHRPYFAKEHLRKYPNHKSYSVKPIKNI